MRSWRLLIRSDRNANACEIHEILQTSDESKDIFIPSVGPKCLYHSIPDCDLLQLQTWTSSFISLTYCNSKLILQNRINTNGIREREKRTHHFILIYSLQFVGFERKTAHFPSHPSEIQIIYIALESRVDIDCLHDRKRGRRRLRRRRRHEKGNENGANNKQEKRKGHKISFMKWIYWNWNFVWSNVLERDVHDPITLLHFSNKHVFSVLEYQDSGMACYL